MSGEVVSSGDLIGCDTDPLDRGARGLLQWGKESETTFLTAVNSYSVTLWTEEVSETPPGIYFSTRF